MDEQKIPVFDDSLDEEELVQAFAPPLPEMEEAPEFTYDNPTYELYKRWFEYHHEHSNCMLPGEFEKNMYSELNMADPVIANFSHLFAVSLANYSQRVVDTFESSTEETDPFPSEIVLRVDSSQMFAMIFIFPPHRDGGDVSEAMLTELLDKNKITFGIDGKKIRDIVVQHSYFKLLIVATGIPVVHGKHGRTREFFLRKPSITLKEDAHGKVDYKNLNLYQTTTKDEIICEYVPPIQGYDGTTVYGKCIKSKLGKPAMTLKGDNTYITEDGKQLRASIPGRIYFHDGSFHVQSCLEIRGNIDNSTGNLSFPGDVIIYGDVLSGFNVQAHGNITVCGMVEAATIYSDADIILSQGMNGDGRGLLVAKGNVISRFLQSCTVRAEESVHSDSIIHSNISCNGSVEVNTGKGAIIGGSVVARNEISAKTIGNQTASKMDIKLGLTAELITKKKMVKDEGKKMKETLDSMEKSVLYLDSLEQLNKKQQAVMKALLEQIPIYREAILKNKADYEELEKELFDFSHCILSFQKLNPPLSLQIGPLIEQLTDSYENGRFQISDNEVHFFSDF